MHPIVEAIFEDKNDSMAIASPGTPNASEPIADSC
jgi:hypothetical protein